MANLRDLRLSEYKVRIYRALLRADATTIKELSHANDVLMGHVYDVLNSLEQCCLSQSRAASQPEKYVAVEPDAVLDRLFESKRQELAEKTEQYENVVTELTDRLDVAEPVRDQFWTTAVGTDETTDLLVE